MADRKDQAASAQWQHRTHFRKIPKTFFTRVQRRLATTTARALQKIAAKLGGWGG
jgi:hypothetical protein